MRTEWNGFTGGEWEREVNVRDFIQKNYHPYDGDESFLAPPTQDTLDLWDQVMELSRKEREAGGVLDMDTKVISTITSHAPGYLNQEKEKIVGLQTDKPFKRALRRCPGRWRCVPGTWPLRSVPSPPQDSRSKWPGWLPER